ncbi:MAG: hypothetical protein AAFY71_16780 [Bacteroidota bacterium]
MQEPVAGFAFGAMIAAILQSFLPILLGWLIVRHRWLLLYLSEYFSFIKEDIDSDDRLYPNYSVGEVWTIFRSEEAPNRVARDKMVKYGTHRLIQFIGRVLIWIGWFGIVSAIFSFIYALTLVS